jgi:hypothetical protein
MGVVKRSEKKRSSGRVYLLTTISALVIITVAFISLSGTGDQEERNSLPPLKNERTIENVADLYYPFILEDDSVDIYLDGPTFFAFWGRSDGSLRIDRPNDEDTVIPESFTSSSGGQSSLRGDEHPGVYTITVSGKLAIMLGDNGISRQIWQDRHLELNVTTPYLAFDFKNIGDMNVELTTNGSVDVYILSTDLTTIYSDSIDNASSTITLHDRLVSRYYLVLACEEGEVGTAVSITCSQATALKNGGGWGALLIAGGLVAIVAYIYFVYYRQEDL